jgi:3-dehydrosphinganine reductase
MRTNYLGAVYCTKCVVDRMKSRKSGRIVFISSQAGQIGVFGDTSYCPTKFALKGFCEALQMELRPYNIHMTLVYPAWVETPGLAQDTNSPLESCLVGARFDFLKPQDVASKTIASIKVRSLEGSETCQLLKIFFSPNRRTAITTVRSAGKVSF